MYVHLAGALLIQTCLEVTVGHAIWHLAGESVHVTYLPVSWLAQLATSKEAVWSRRSPCGCQVTKLMQAFKPAAMDRTPDSTVYTSG